MKVKNKEKVSVREIKLTKFLQSISRFGAFKSIDYLRDITLRTYIMCNMFDIIIIDI